MTDDEQKKIFLTNISQLRFAAVAVAKRQIGYRETEGNNAGPFIRALGGNNGDEWCALFYGWCYLEGAAKLKLPPPVWCFTGNDLKKRQKGAKALAKQLGAVGSIWDPAKNGRLPLIGDAVVWSRGVLGWQGHIGMVTSVNQATGSFKYVAGNEGKDGRVLERAGSRYKLWRFASLEKR